MPNTPQLRGDPAGMVKDKGIGVAYIPLTWMLQHIGWAGGPPQGGATPEKSSEVVLWVELGPRERKVDRKGRMAAAMLGDGELELEQSSEVGDGPPLLRMPGGGDVEQPTGCVEGWALLFGVCGGGVWPCCCSCVQHTHAYGVVCRMKKTMHNKIHTHTHTHKTLFITCVTTTNTHHNHTPTPQSHTHSPIIFIHSFHSFLSHLRGEQVRVAMTLEVVPHQHALQNIGVTPAAAQTCMAMLASPGGLYLDVKSAYSSAEHCMLFVGALSGMGVNAKVCGVCVCGCVGGWEMGGVCGQEVCRDVCVFIYTYGACFM